MHNVFHGQLSEETKREDCGEQLKMAAWLWCVRVLRKLDDACGKTTREPQQKTYVYEYTYVNRSGHRMQRNRVFSDMVPR